MKETKEKILERTKIIKKFWENQNQEHRNQLEEKLKKFSKIISKINNDKLQVEYEKILSIINDKKENKKLDTYDQIYGLLKNVENIIEEEQNEELEDLLEITKSLQVQIKPYTLSEADKVVIAMGQLIDIVEELNDEQINQKFEGIKKVFMEKDSQEYEQIIKYIEAFESSVEKNITLTEYNNTADKLNNNDEKSKVYETLENFKYAIMCKDKITIVNSQRDLISFALSLSLSNATKINNVLEPLTGLLISKEIATLTEEEIQEALKMVEELEEIIDSLNLTKEEELPIPETIDELKQEMDNILGISLLNEIENIDLKEDKFAILEQEKKDKLLTLKDEIKGCQFSMNPNKKEIENLRLEMYLILGNEIFDPYKTHKETIALLDDKKKERFNKLKEVFNKKIKEEIEKRKENNRKTENKTELELSEREQKFINNDYFLDKKIRKIREEMATLVNGENMEHTAYEGIENIDVDSKIENENDKERFKELREELIPLLAKKAKRTNKKGKLVKFKKSAKEFYQKHKKGIWIATGIALFAVSIPHLLPSVMYLNSALWHTAVTSGAVANAGLPALLHDVNLIFGSQIGASYAASSGLWTLANGTLLNATAAEAGILTVLGKLTAITLPFVGINIARKNACKLAKEKIQKRKEKIEKETPERKGHFFKDIKEYAKNKFNTVKDGAKNLKENVTTKFNDTKESISNKFNEIKSNHEKKKEEKVLKKEEKVNNKTALSMLQEAYMLGFITDEQFEKYSESDTQEIIDFMKSGFQEEKGKGI